MKQKLAARLITLKLICLNIIAIAQGSYGQQRTYDCQQIQGIPTTIARTSRGTLPIIRWVSTANLPPGLTPQQRCEQVSTRLQAYRDRGELRYITNDTINGQPVICVARQRGGDCTGVLFTLQAGSDPKRVLKRLLNQQGLGAGNPLNEGGERIYIDVNDYLNRVSAE